MFQPFNENHSNICYISRSENSTFTGIKPPATGKSFVKCPSESTKASTILDKLPTSRGESSLHSSSTLGALPCITTESNEGPISRLPNHNHVHLGIGLAKVSNLRPKTIGPPETKEPTKASINVPLHKSTESPTFSLVSHLGASNNDLNIRPGRPSLGASPKLRSDDQHRSTFSSAAVGSCTNPSNNKPGFTNMTGTNKTNGNILNTGTKRTPSNTKSNPTTNKPKPVTSPDLFKIPTPPPPTRRSTESAQKSNAPFKVPTPPAAGRDSLGNLTSLTWRGSGLSNRTPNYQNISKGNMSISSDMHRTPPMCECGRRTKRRVVQSPGANQGRAFYCCTLGRSTSAGDISTFGKKTKTGCKYFKWESSVSPSLNNANNSSFNSTRNSNLSMNSTVNSTWNSSKLSNFNRSVSWNSFERGSSNYTRNKPTSSPSEQFLGKPPSQKPGPRPNDNSNRSPDIINLSPPHYRSPDLLNDSTSSLEQFPLLPPDAFSDPDKT